MALATAHKVEFLHAETMLGQQQTEDRLQYLEQAIVAIATTVGASLPAKKFALKSVVNDAMHEAKYYSHGRKSSVLPNGEEPLEAADVNNYEMEAPETDQKILIWTSERTSTHHHR